ncbi:MAG: hypothetical protein ISR90_02945 [Candidatus Marinimicrobia bacterium]|nr:hypothetical protein [Candidatus Neomarinimicrobiota bacterium]MBL7022997.1 hypothetical protein [Candidatus Neomarinimicrobiota bacterium]MBL7110014.1 hypothetical protein [Candidatus Neomarinimicrobiota bacterium]
MKFDKTILNWFVTFVSVFSLLIPQEHLSIHIRELLQNKNTIIDFEKIDLDAKNIKTPERYQTVLSREIVGYLPYWMYSEYPSLRYDLLSQINYFSAELDSYGNITNYHNWLSSDLVEFAHDRNVKVKLCATLFGSSSLENLLGNPQNRTNAIQNLLSAVSEVGGDGVDIDFELLPSSMRDSLNVFMLELVNTFHENIPGSIVTMATPAIDWSNAWDFNYLAQITDGLFIMGYDYHWSSGPTAGPVSPLGGFYYDLDYTVVDYLDETNYQSDKIILGLPYYGYDWPVMDNSIYSQTTGSATARTYANIQNMLGVESLFNESTSSSWFVYQDTNWRQCWYDDSLTLSIKYQYADVKELSGIGMWALGYDGNNTQLWDAIYNQYFECVIGDLNQDDTFDVYDIVQIIDFILESDSIPNEYEFCASDLNQDSIINIVDVVLLSDLINR